MQFHEETPLLYGTQHVETKVLEQFFMKPVRYT